MAELNEPLTERELEVLTLLVKGHSNKEIAQELGISPNTVKVHIRNIFAKLGVSSRAEAIVEAIERGLVTLSGEIPDDSDPEPEPLIDLASSTFTRPIQPVVQDPDSEEDSAPPFRQRARWLWPIIAALAVLVAIVAILANRLDPFSTDEPECPRDIIQIGETRWFTGQPAAEARSGGSLVPSGINLFFMGGENEAGELLDRVDILNTQENCWESSTRMPEPIADAGAGVLDGIIYVVGGRTAEGPTDRVHAYSPSLAGWRETAPAPLPSALSAGLVLVEDDSLFHFGGFNGTEAVADVYVYNQVTDGWRALPNMPRPIAFAAGGIIENRAYVIGGEADGRELDSCYVFDIEVEIWEQCADISVARSRAGGAVILDKLYLLGGKTSVTYGEVYNPEQDIWEIINLPDQGDGEFERFVDWRTPAVANMEARIFIIGGQIEGIASRDTYIYAPLVYQSYIPATINE